MKTLSLKLDDNIFNETEDVLEGQYGSNAKVACIGPAGEKLSLISCIITYKGDAAGRSGLGAVMGSKKLKAGKLPVAAFSLKVSTVCRKLVGWAAMAASTDGIVPWRYRW